jgi:hypothetical protein
MSTVDSDATPEPGRVVISGAETLQDSVVSDRNREIGRVAIAQPLVPYEIMKTAVDAPSDVAPFVGKLDPKQREVLHMAVLKFRAFQNFIQLSIA